MSVFSMGGAGNSRLKKTLWLCLLVSAYALANSPSALACENGQTEACNGGMCGCIPNGDKQMPGKLPKGTVLSPSLNGSKIDLCSSWDDVNDCSPEGQKRAASFVCAQLGKGSEAIDKHTVPMSGKAWHLNILSVGGANWEMLDTGAVFDYIVCRKDK